jgi:MYXO-CTERM domain-containing protein
MRMAANLAPVRFQLARNGKNVAIPARQGRGIRVALVGGMRTQLFALGMAITFVAASATAASADCYLVDEWVGDQVMSPSVTVSGDTYLVRWHTGGESGQQYKAALDRDGDILRVDEVDAERAYERLPTFAGAGGYIQTDVSDDLSTAEFARLDRFGDVVGTDEVFMSDDVRSIGTPTVAYNGTGFIAAWSAATDVNGPDSLFVARLDRDGEVDTTEIVHVGARVYVAALVTTRAVVWVVFGEEVGGDRRLRALRIGTDGSVLDATPVDFGVTGGYHASASRGFEAMVLAWRYDDQIDAIILDEDGIVLGPTTHPIDPEPNGEDSLAPRPGLAGYALLRAYRDTVYFDENAQLVSGPSPEVLSARGGAVVVDYDRFVVVRDQYETDGDERENQLMVRTVDIDGAVTEIAQVAEYDQHIEQVERCDYPACAIGAGGGRAGVWLVGIALIAAVRRRKR